MFNNYKKQIKSVYPSSTCAGVTSYLTSKYPVSHGFIGRSMYHKKTNEMVLAFQYQTLPDYQNFDYSYEEFFDFQTIFENSSKKGRYFTPSHLTGPYNKQVSKGAESIAYDINNLDDLRDKIIEISGDQTVSMNIVYIEDYDLTAHKYGPQSKEALAVFKKYDNFFKTLQDLNAEFFVSSDHGFLDVSEAYILDLKDHPEFLSYLSLDLGGEPRYAFFHVRDEDKFLKYYNDNLSKYFYLYSRQDVLDMNLFGKGEVHSKLYERMGDYLGIMKSNYMIKNSNFEDMPSFAGMHGGLSKMETEIPLVMF